MPWFVKNFESIIMTADGNRTIANNKETLTLSWKELRPSASLKKIFSAICHRQSWTKRT